MIISSLCVATIILAAVAFYIRAAQTNPVERRVNRSLKRMLQRGLPTTAPVGAKGYTLQDLLPRGGARQSREISSPAWA